MITMNRNMLKLLLEEMDKQHLDEVEIVHDNGYGMNYNQSITFRDINWYGRWNKEQNDDYNLLKLQEYNTYIDVSGSCIKWIK